MVMIRRVMEIRYFLDRPDHSGLLQKKVLIHCFAKWVVPVVAELRGKPGVRRLEIELVGAEKYGQGDWNVGPYVTFIHNILDHPRMKDMYKIWLGFVKGQGISTHSNFQDYGSFSKWGQWAMTDNLMETDEQAPRYAFIRDWSIREKDIREVWKPLNKRPVFNTPETLPSFTNQAVFAVPLVLFPTIALSD